MYDAEGHRRDQVHQGRMILLGIGVAYLTLWLMEYFMFPTMLVPGFLLDRSPATLINLIGMAGQFAFLGIFWLLTWAGVGWTRYVLGAFLLVSGMVNVILSILIGVNGGIQLVLGALSITSAAALMLSLSMEKYGQDRRQKAFPLLDLGLGIVGMTTLLIAVAAIQLLQTWMMVQTNRQETVFASGILEKLLPNLDASVLTPVASETFRQDMAASDLTGQFAAMKQDLGSFRAWAPASIQALVVNPRRSGHLVAFNTLAHYEKGDLMCELNLDTASQPWQVDAIYIEKVSMPIHPIAH
jgi:hypothetical protein